jgi:Tol biopolymer transport system component
MTKTLYKRLIKLAGCFLCFLFIVPACTILGAGAPEATLTPQPTSSIPNMQVIAAQACQVAEQSMIRVEAPQGDLIAWSPLSDAVAYVASTQGSSWNIGELNLLSSPKFDTSVRLATGVAGELAWAPDASAIAYLGLRRSDNLYTIGLAHPNAQASQDLFPNETARTDDYSSQKLILGWMDTSRLRVLVSCGINCMQTLMMDVQSGLSSQVGDPIHRYWDMWSVHTLLPTSIPTQYAGLTGQLNWSPDEQRIAYIDGAGNAWVVNAGSGSLYPLDIGQYGTATETDWSSDSQYLAVQVDQYLKIFSFKCP